VLQAADRLTEKGGRAASRGQGCVNSTCEAREFPSALNCAMAVNKSLDLNSGDTEVDCGGRGTGREQEELQGLGMYV
jgi:hypothetical protein